MAAKTEQNFRLNIGEDATLAFTVTDSAGDPVDISAGSAVWNMRAHELSTSDDLSIAGSSLTSGGTFSVVIADTDTDSINPGVYYHEAKYTDASSNETIVARGSVQLDASVT